MKLLFATRNRGKLRELHQLMGYVHDLTLLSVDDVPDGGAQTSWTAPTLANGNYWWRAWSGDGSPPS